MNANNKYDQMILNDYERLQKENEELKLTINTQKYKFKKLMELLKEVDFKLKQPELNPMDLKLDEKILVSNDKETWYRHHFARYSKCYVHVWNEGKTSFTEDDKDDTVYYRHWKRPEEDAE